MSSSYVFIVAPLQRSGTNFLADLLALHRDCGRLVEIGEDFVLDEAHHLERYVDRVLVHWRKHQTPGEQARLGTRLRTALGETVVKTLDDKRAPADREARYIVTKTPSVRNLARYPAFFGKQKLVIIVRDGRDTVESGMRSFNWRFRNSALAWRDAAHTVQGFLQSEHGRDALLVRYEDLVADYRPVLRRILSHLALDEAGFDYAAADALPVRGSSELRSGAKTKVHWQPVARSETFKPVARWHAWQPRAKAQFLWWAGRELCHFGYADDAALPDSRRTTAWRYRWRDWRYSWRLGRSLTQPWRRLQARVARRH